MLQGRSWYTEYMFPSFWSHQYRTSGKPAAFFKALNRSLSEMETTLIIVSVLNGIQYIWHAFHRLSKYEWHGWVVFVSKDAQHLQGNHVYWPQDFFRSLKVEDRGLSDAYLMEILTMSWVRDICSSPRLKALRKAWIFGAIKIFVDLL